MTNEELDKIIDRIEQDCLESEAYFDSDFNADFGMAKGNKVGLLLYAKEFIKAARSIDERKFDQGETEVYNPDFKWIMNEDANPFQYIKVTRKLPGEIHNKGNEQKQSWKGKLYGVGCVVLLIFTLILILVGLYQFIKWIF